MASGMSVVLTLPLRQPLLTQNAQRRAHWTAVRAAKRDTEIVVGEAVKAAGVGPIEGPVTVQLIWFAPDARNRDTDGLAPMMKAVLDALVKKGVLPDDNAKVVTETICGPIVVSRDNPRFEVHIRRVAQRRSLRPGWWRLLVPRAGWFSTRGEDDLQELPCFGGVLGVCHGA